MVLGTASSAGKSLLVAALCRIFAQDGWRVAPFKAQNMSLNSAATPDGYEIGRAQALQAEAAGIQPTVDMNPILLKPTSDRRSQVVLLGRIWKDLSAREYHGVQVETLFPEVLAAYRRLAEAYDLIVLEGAGSPAEINLKAHDIVNMRMAEAAGARCVLVGDIDRGGVFAALLGTLELLEPHERRRIASFVINKFRGERALLDDGIAAIEQRLHLPCAGVIPWIEDLGLDEEDSLALDARPRVTRLAWRNNDDPGRALRVAVVALPHLANFTDFDALAAESSVELGYARSAAELARADLIVVPGTKSTVADLEWLRANGLAQAIVSAAACVPVVGICGGMQMLGRTIADPHGVEGGASSTGMSLLRIDTVLGTEKITTPVRGRFAAATLFGAPVDAEVVGYEIHVGRTAASPETRPLLLIARNGGDELVPDGAIDETGRVIGTYVHGLFAEDAPRHAFVRAARAAAGLAPPRALALVAAERQARLDRLADHVRASLDLSLLVPA
jgi:adenosylcobyric acid synthase